MPEALESDPIEFILRRELHEETDLLVGFHKLIKVNGMASSSSLIIHLIN